LTDDGELAIQFRAARSALDLDHVGYIKQIYGNFVPRHEISGRLGELHVYKMDNVGGIAMYLAREQLLQHNCRLLRQTVQDFAMSVDANVSSPLSDVKENMRLTFGTQLLHLRVA
jgi:hypothetical protein